MLLSTLSGYLPRSPAGQYKYIPPDMHDLDTLSVIPSSGSLHLCEANPGRYLHPCYKLTGACIPFIFSVFITLFLTTSCDNPDEQHLFQMVPSSHSGINFNNRITESDSLNVLKFEYIYNGAGVGIGDFNNDGLSDIFFAGNMVSSKLYLNTGNFVFKDITTTSRTETSAWCTGVAVVDINQDGKLDIHVATAHPDMNKSSANLVFLNLGNDSDGIPVFREVAAEVGLADGSYSTQAAFFDYDLDGDLDVYLLTNALEIYNRNTLLGQYRGSGKSKDKLFRNEGISGNDLPVFKDVSVEAGLLEEGWGLGISIADLNRDGYPDIYVANDFQSNDLLYINNHNGTFANRIADFISHQSQNSMGMDIADFNNDGLEDIVVVDMMPEDNLRQKTMFPRVEYDRFQSARQKGYQPQYVRNVLQLNNGNNTFSDIGYMAGVYATDWSWSALFADFDNDGRRDLFISNGYRKDVTNLDFVSYRKESTMFGTKDTRENVILKSLEDLEGVKKPSFVFSNNGDLTFSNKANEWGLAQPSYSNGVAYADLDNDGDLDLVMNNINDEAFIYRNTLIDAGQKDSKNDSSHFLRIELKGKNGNSHGLGARITIFDNGTIQFAEHKLQRGYKTTVEPFIHFGLGGVDRVDSVLVEWPAGGRQVLRQVDVNQVLLFDEKDSDKFTAGQGRLPEIFEEVSKVMSLTNVMPETDYADLKTQRLLIQKYSQGGPGIASGDINGDSREDIIIGSPVGRATLIFLRKVDGTFFLADSIKKSGEDMGVLLFDADGDRDLDLYCVSGSSEFGNREEMYQDRFYRNDGHGKFDIDPVALPRIADSGSTVRACDFDKDGDLDLFVGGRIIPEQYPFSPRSHLLRNNGQGKFEDVTPSIAPTLSEPGMVTDALWSDFNNDGWTDLILAGEFMPITFFANHSGTELSPVNSIAASREEHSEKVGFWNSIVGGDFDNDGDIDYICGNLGHNSFYKASDEQPLTVYAKDFDQNGSIEPILTHFNQGKEYIVHYRETLIDQLPMLRKKLKRYDTYGNAVFSDLFTPDMLKGAYIRKANYLRSTYIENSGQGKFIFHELPAQVQVAPVFGMAVTDYDMDGNLDVITVGNSYAAEPLSGWYDAGIGSVLKGNGSGDFTVVPVTETGFLVNKDAKSFIEILQPGSPPLWVATQNQDSLRVFVNRGIPRWRIISLKPSDVHAELKLANGRTRKQEFYYGNGYLAQSSRAFIVPPNTLAVTVFNTDGERREVGIE